MLELKFIREYKQEVEKALKDRGDAFDLDYFLKIDEEHRKILSELESLRHRRKKASDEIAQLKKAGRSAEDLIARMKDLSREVKALEEKERNLGRELLKMHMAVPNIPDESVPGGKSEEENVEVKRWGLTPDYDFTPLTHVQLGENLGLLDFGVSSKIAGSGFAFYKAAGARLVRGLINFMLELHCSKHGYTEVFPPFLANRACMTGTGQLPKLEDDMYRLESDDLFLIPTAEVPVTNIHRDEIIDGSELPLYYTAYTACFRREAGAYGRDTKGLVRLHQFDKVELVKFVCPENSGEELEKLLADAEEVLQLLGLHYRVLSLCTGDLSFASSKCYDIEVWEPGVRKYLEVSSCSNFSGFQARRAGIRYRPAPGEKPEYVHTLNGSGLALPRLMVAIMETFQTKEGSIEIPGPLVPYMGGKRTL